MSVNLTLAPAQSPIRKLRKTIAFDGSAGNGAVGTVAVATVSGDVLIHRAICKCTEDLTEAAPTATIDVGTTTVPAALFANPTGGPTAIDSGEYWGNTATTATLSARAATGSYNANSGGTTSNFNKALSESIIVTVGTQNVTNGTLEFTFWWEPISDGATLT